MRQIDAVHIVPKRDTAAVQVVGEQSYQENLLRVAGPLTPTGPTIQDHMAALILEPTNRYDPNAIAVYVSGQHAGYLSRQDAVAFGPVLRWLAMKGKALAVDAMVTGGWRRSSTDIGVMGVVLHLGTPSECMAELLEDDSPIRTDHGWGGLLVVFTGDSHCCLADVPIDRHTLEWYAAKAGMIVMPRVTKKVQLVVLCDTSGQTGKGMKAQEYGLPTVTEGEFWARLGVDARDIGRPVHGWRTGL